ncbi:MAG: tautomerase family protein [Pseudomonadota bacterium]
MPHVQITLFEGRTQAQKKAVAVGIMRVLEQELGALPAHNWIVFTDKSLDDWFVGYDSQSEIDARREPGPEDD